MAAVKSVAGQQLRIARELLPLPGAVGSLMLNLRVLTGLRDLRLDATPISVSSLGQLAALPALEELLSLRHTDN